MHASSVGAPATAPTFEPVHPLALANGHAAPDAPEWGHVAAEVFAAELAGHPVPARAVYADITRVPGERLPIIPPNLRGRQNIRATIAVVGGQQWHRTRYHGLRAPLYLFAVLAWAVVGVFRLAARQVH